MTLFINDDADCALNAKWTTALSRRVLSLLFLLVPSVRRRPSWSPFCYANVLWYARISFVSSSLWPLKLRCYFSISFVMFSLRITCCSVINLLRFSLLLIVFSISGSVIHSTYRVSWQELTASIKDLRTLRAQSIFAFVRCHSFSSIFFVCN